MAQTVLRLHPVARQGGFVIEELVTSPNWVDNVVLVASTAQAYTIPFDTTQKATILRIRASVGPVYINIFGATATVPAASTSTGAGELQINTSEHIWLDLPGNTTSISFICASAAVLSIECWT